MVEYTYDAWGAITSITGSMADTLGRMNPFRYRSYYYDAETELYYLQSRYYDPAMGRFLNADDPTMLFLVGGKALGANLFAYCFNNPVMFIDPDGQFALAIPKAVLAMLFIVVVCVLVLGLMITQDPSFQRAHNQLIADARVAGTNALNTVRTAVDSLMASVRAVWLLAILRARNNRFENHHIVAQTAVRASTSRGFLNSVGIGINSPPNMVLIRYNLHRHLHTNAYHDSVTALLRPHAGNRSRLVNTLNFIGIVLHITSTATP